MPYNAKTIVVINKSTCVPNATIAKYVAAVQKQVNNDFGPVWGYFANLKLIPEQDLKNYPGAWMCVFLDYPPKEFGDMQGVLGFHDVYITDATPISYVFAKTDLDFKLDPCVTFSHEILEMLADCYCTFNALIDDTLYSIEVADAVEDDGDAYVIGDQRVSNFMFPEWFDPRCKGKKVDFRGLCRTPLQILPGGYMPVFTIGKDKEWRDLFGPKAKRLEVKNQTRPQFTRRAARNRLLLETTTHKGSDPA